MPRKIGRRSVRMLGNVMDVSPEVAGDPDLRAYVESEVARVEPRVVDRWLPWRPLGTPEFRWREPLDFLPGHFMLGYRQMWEARYIGRGSRAR